MTTNNNADAITFSDTAGDTFVSDFDSAMLNTYRIACAHVVYTIGGGSVVTGTQNNTSFSSLLILEFINTAAVDGASVGVGTGTTATSPTITTTATNDLIIAIYTQNASMSGVLTMGGGFTKAVTSSYGVAWYGFAPSAGSVSVSGTYPTSGSYTWIAGIIAFKHS